MEISYVINIFLSIRHICTDDIVINKHVCIYVYVFTYVYYDSIFCIVKMFFKYEIHCICKNKRDIKFKIKIQCDTFLIYKYCDAKVVRFKLIFHS